MPVLGLITLLGVCAGREEKGGERRGDTAAASSVLVAYICILDTQLRWQLLAAACPSIAQGLTGTSSLLWLLSALGSILDSP